MEVKYYILNLLREMKTQKKDMFYTHDIANLGLKAKASASTLERKFRRLREDGTLIIERVVRMDGGKEAKWKIIQIND